jgi:hypothetical protein
MQEGILMKASDLMRMSVEDVEAIEKQLWKEWEMASNVLKVLKAVEKEEE